MPDFLIEACLLSSSNAIRQKYFFVYALYNQDKHSYSSPVQRASGHIGMVLTLFFKFELTL